MIGGSTVTEYFTFMKQCMPVGNNPKYTMSYAAHAGYNEKPNTSSILLRSFHGNRIH